MRLSEFDKIVQCIQLHKWKNNKNIFSQIWLKMLSKIKFCLLRQKQTAEPSWLKLHKPPTPHGLLLQAVDAIWQLVPRKPCLQVQVYWVEDKTLHVAPFKHGPVWQGFDVIWDWLVVIMLKSTVIDAIQWRNDCIVLINKTTENLFLMR